jgi:hypothetical protein
MKRSTSRRENRLQRQSLLLTATTVVRGGGRPFVFSVTDQWSVSSVTVWISAQLLKRERQRVEQRR